MDPLNPYCLVGSRRTAGGSRGTVDGGSQRNSHLGLVYFWACMRYLLTYACMYGVLYSK